MMTREENSKEPLIEEKKYTRESDYNDILWFDSYDLLNEKDVINRLLFSQICPGNTSPFFKYRSPPLPFHRMCMTAPPKFLTIGLTQCRPKQSQWSIPKFKCLWCFITMRCSERGGQVSCTSLLTVSRKEVGGSGTFPSSEESREEEDSWKRTFNQCFWLLLWPLKAFNPFVFLVIPLVPFP